MLLNIKLCFVLIGLTNRKHSMYFISALRKRWVPGAKKLLAPISFVCFSEMRTPSSAGESKKALASSIERSEKGAATLPLSRKLILDRQRPFTGCRASDASGGFFSAS